MGHDMVRLTDEEEAMRTGALGEPRRLAIEQQIQVAGAFDAPDFVAVSQVHLMGDTESLGESGVEYLEAIATAPPEHRRVRVPTVTDPRGIDLCAYRSLRQEERWAELERRTTRALSALGVLMTDTCINYQTVMPPVQGEHLAFGDTGSTIYANSVCGARSNFEGGPAALAAALTGRVPRYGMHLDSARRGTHRFEVEERPRTLSDWGALGAVVGKTCRSYWTVPVVGGIDAAPTSDELKHFGAALASYGSVPLFHMVGVTPEAPTLEDCFDGPPPDPIAIGPSRIADFYRSFGRHEDGVDVVVFAAPQLSLLELQQLAELLRGRRVHRDTALMIATAPEVKSGADRLGLTALIEEAGGRLLQGVCFYQMYARETGEANGWRRLVSNSAKLCNIIAGYGYQPVLASMEACVEAAVAGRMSR
jgi:predicted aconitase